MDDIIDPKHTKNFKLGLEMLQGKFLFIWTILDCKSEKGNKVIDNPKNAIHTKSLKMVWKMHTQFDPTNIVIVHFSLREEKKISNKICFLLLHSMEQTKMIG